VSQEDLSPEIETRNKQKRREENYPNRAEAQIGPERNRTGFASENASAPGIPSFALRMGCAMLDAQKQSAHDFGGREKL
jgi:hypothetical protein